jgi:hypothetical protein
LRALTVIVLAADPDGAIAAGPFEGPPEPPTTRD